MREAELRSRVTETPSSNTALPFLVLKEGATKKKGKETLAGNIALASMIGELMETAFGPRGFKKIITGVRDVTGWAPLTTYITSDGATILNEIKFEHPIGKIMTDTARATDEEVGDGVKTAVILLSKLLEKSQKLIEEGLHPRTIIDGYQKAYKKTMEILDQAVIPVNLDDDNLLKKVAITAMSSKLPSDSSGYIADIVVKAVNCVLEQGGCERRIDIDNIKIEKQEGGSLLESCFIDGWVVSYPITRFDMPRCVENAKIALITRPIEAVSMGKYSKWGDSVKIIISKKEHMGAFVEEERNIARRMVEKIRSSEANVVISNWNIDDVALSLFAKAGVLACKRVLMPDLAKIVKAVGGTLVKNLDELSPETLGTSKLVFVEKLCGKEYLFLKECKNPKAVSIMLRGGTKFIVDEAERAVRDALCAIREMYKKPEVVVGGGAFEAQVASELKTYSKEIGSREQLAIEACAEAFEALCALLSKNAGLNPIDVLADIRTRHAEGERWAGVDAYKRVVSNMKDLGVYEPKRIKLQAIQSAYETAKLILRVDYSSVAKPSKREKPREKPLTEEDVEKLERSLVPKVMETTKPEHKFPWEKGLRT